jgi:DNA repair protein RecO (recombination protein O)
MSTGLYLAELSEKFSVEGGSNPSLFRHLLASLAILDGTAPNPLFPRWFEIRLLDLAGFLPTIGACVDCGDLLNPQDHFFSAGRGGLVCPSCKTAESDVLLPACVGAIKLLRYLANSEWAMVAQINVLGQDMRQVTRILQEHIHHVTDRRIRSAAFMDEIASKTF